MLRAGIFALTGLAFFGYWVVVRPSFAVTSNQATWSTVLFFSAALLSLAVALPVFGRMVGGRWVTRSALVAGCGVGLSSVANLFEDGLGIDWVFFVFILGELILLVALILLGVLIVATRPGRLRLLALVPVGTVAGILLFVVAGGTIMLGTWGAAAVVAVTRAARSTDAPDQAAVA